MQLDRFTTKAQGALQDAQRIAQEHSHQALDGEHLLMALLQQSEGLVQPLLQKMGVQPSQLERELETELARRATVQGGGKTYLSPELEKALDAAEKEARNLKDEYTST
jgi:ATP-dependent Clp protease ATP-binding subunit ClpB